MATFLVTGASGFIGVNLVERLLGAGHRVVCLSPDGMPARAANDLAALPGRLVDIRGDVRDAALLGVLFSAHRFDAVLAGAAITAGPERERTNPSAIFDVNLVGVARTLEAAETAGVRRLVCFSSTAAVGERAFGATPIGEDEPPAPLSLYGVTKAAIEGLAARWNGLDRRCEVAVVRLSAVFGAWERSTGVRDTLSPPYQLASAIVAGDAIAPLPQGGDRDWVDAPYVAKALEWLLTDGVAAASAVQRRRGHGLASAAAGRGVRRSGRQRRRAIRRPRDRVQRRRHAPPRPAGGATHRRRDRRAADTTRRGRGLRALGPCAPGVVRVTTPPRIPVIVLTGFLGSGKTTLLNALLRDRRWADTLVIVNEVGEIGLDHLLIERSDDNVLLLDSGCMCCAMQGGFRETLADLYVRRANGSIPPFARVVVETTGLADPGPIVNALAADSLLREEFVLAGVVTTVDCLAGGDTLDRQWEAVRQAAMADSIVLTKTDLVPAEQIAEMEARIAAIAPFARRIRSAAGGSAVELLDPHDLTAGAGRAARRPSEGLFASGGRLAPQVPQHDAGIRARSFVLRGPVTWADLAAWQSAIVERFGDRVLRVKGLVEIAETGKPIVIHGIGRYFHPPERLAGWPSDDHRSRLVLIGRDVDDAVLDEAMTLLAPVAAGAVG